MSPAFVIASPRRVRPAQPTQLGFSAVYAGYFVIDWSAPLDDGGIAIVDYVVQVSSDNRRWATVDDGVSAASYAFVVGLQGKTRYWVRVAAVNGVGAGRFTESIDAVTD
jgi:hypothetical protein